jgi:flagellar hook-associated protein 2
MMETDLLNSLGVGAGFDTKNLVKTLVNAEKASAQAGIDRRTKDVEANITGMGQVKSALQTLKTAFETLNDKRDFNFPVLSNSAPESVYASFDASAAAPGTYVLGVSQLAQNDVLKTTNFSSVTDDQNSSTAATITIQIGSETAQTVTLSAGSGSLTDLVTGINSLDMGVTARTVETSTGSYTVLVEGPQGSSNTLTITDTVFGLASSANKLQSAQDSIINVNGLTVTSATNEVENVVSGLKLDLMAVTSANVTLNVSRDISVAQYAITNLVEVYNSFEGIMTDLTSSQGSTGTSGAFSADSSIRAIRNVVRNFLMSDSSTPGTSITHLSDMGISLNRNGLFSVNKVTLGTALSGSYADVTKMFSANTDDQTSYGTASRGLAGDVIDQIDNYLAYDGIVKVRQTSYTTTQGDLSDRQLKLDEKMLNVEARYTRQFSNMNKIMDEMKSMQEYLDQQLSNLPFTANND